MKYEKPVIIFDGVCNLCNATVDFILKRDDKKQFRFVAFQSGRGEELIDKFNIGPRTDSVILIVGNRVYIESAAAIEILWMLPQPWNWFVISLFSAL